MASSRAVSAAVAGAFFAYCLLLQSTAGAWRADFAAHSDEPAHFVGAVMVRDYLVSGRLLDPYVFAQDYYLHYPFFSVGYWPPAFYSVTALWFLVAGVGRVQALLVPAIFAAGTGWLIVWLVRPRAGLTVAICTGALYLSLPTVQQSVCQVMADHMTTFFCVAGGVCLLRYLKAPGLRQGLLYVVCCVCAVLSKYSAAYMLMLPVLAAWLTRHRGLWRKPSLFLQPVLVALVVGPWVTWTRHLAFYGLPAEKKALTLARIASFLWSAFRIFPPALMLPVVIGLIALLLFPKLWSEDVAVAGLLGAGNLGLLVLSPVGVESRYLLVTAVSLLVLSADGWAGAWSSLTPRVRRPAVQLAAAGLAAGFVLVHFTDYRLPPPSPIGAVVQSVQRNPAWAGRSIVVPSDLEGPFIAGFVAQDRHRPSYYLLRPSKIMASMNWFGGNYRSRFGSPAEVMDSFRRNQVELIVSHQDLQKTLAPHERILRSLQGNCDWWRRIRSFGSGSDLWTVYQRVSQ